MNHFIPFFFVPSMRVHFWNKIKHVTLQKPEKVRIFQLTSKRISTNVLFENTIRNFRCSQRTIFFFLPHKRAACETENHTCTKYFIKFTAFKMHSPYRSGVWASPARKKESVNAHISTVLRSSLGLYAYALCFFRFTFLGAGGRGFFTSCWLSS